MVCVLLFGCAVRLSAGEHPVALEKNTDAAKCLECHEDKSKGTHVHSAIAMGCTTCHEVKVDKDVTNVDLVSPKQEICLTCHEKAKDTSVHPPYEKGNCVTCHDPHVSEFDKQLRAGGNALCLECHAERRISGKFSAFKGAQEFSEDEFQAIPKINLDPTQRFGHPIARHRVAEAPDPLHPGQKIGCLTCHAGHSSDREKLLRSMEVNKKKIEVCDACHSANDEAAMAAAQKRSDELEAQRLKEQEARAKQPNVTPERAPKTKEKRP
jgi:predicted CXXCH cytochrome family protein